MVDSLPSSKVCSNTFCSAHQAQHHPRAPPWRDHRSTCTTRTGMAVLLGSPRATSMDICAHAGAAAIRATKCGERPRTPPQEEVHVAATPRATKLVLPGADVCAEYGHLRKVCGTNRHRACACAHPKPATPRGWSHRRHPARYHRGLFHTQHPRPTPFRPAARQGIAVQCNHRWRKELRGGQNYSLKQRSCYV